MYIQFFIYLVWIFILILCRFEHKLIIFGIEVFYFETYLILLGLLLSIFFMYVQVFNDNFIWNFIVKISSIFSTFLIIVIFYIFQNEFIMSSDFAINYEFMQLRRIYSVSEIQEKLLTTRHYYGLLSFDELNEIAKKSNGSIEEAKRLAHEHYESKWNWRLKTPIYLIIYLGGFIVTSTLLSLFK